MDAIVEKTEIYPTVLVIHPSGYTEFLQIDVNPVSFHELGELIDAEGLDYVCYSDSLAQITKECCLNRNLTMYFDRDSILKGLEYNDVGTMLYGSGAEVMGAVIIALEDDECNAYAFDMEEDIEDVFEAIDELTGLLRRETDDDGRYDAWS